MDLGFPLTADRGRLAAIGALSGTLPGFATSISGIEAAWLRFARPLVRRRCAGVSERQGRPSERPAERSDDAIEPSTQRRRHAEARLPQDT